MKTIKVILLSSLFVFGGFVLLSYPDAPEWIGWFVISFFGIGGCLFAFITIYQKYRSRQVHEHSQRVVLKDGNDYEVQVSDHRIRLIHTISKKTKIMSWSDLIEIYAIAIDAFPVGRISWVFHSDSDAMEIPWDTKNGDALLNQMQTKLPGFNNEAVIEISSTLHGYQKVWGKQ